MGFIKSLKKALGFVLEKIETEPTEITIKTTNPEKNQTFQFMLLCFYC